MCDLALRRVLKFTGRSDNGFAARANVGSWPPAAEDDDSSILKNIREDELAAIEGTGKLAFPHVPITDAIRNSSGLPGDAVNRPHAHAAHRRTPPASA